MFLGTLLVLPFSGGDAITPQESGAWAYAYRAWLLLLALGFFGTSWTRRGQTLGMMSWGLRLQRDDGGLPRWRNVLGRLALGGAIVMMAAASLWVLRGAATARSVALGIVLLLPALANYAWMFADPGARTLVDRCSRCRVIRLP